MTQSARKAVVTGGGGFIGAYLTRQLVTMGWDVTVVDDMTRGAPWRLEPILSDIRLEKLDVRDTNRLTEAAQGCEVMFHLAAVNGTENFYKRPELVLDVGLRGALAVVEACQNADVPDLVVASSAEVYQTPAQVPTSETVALMLPDSLNPRYSYGGSKIVSELIAFNYGQDHFRKVQVFRPHNVYGPDMGYKHVIPQFILRANELEKRARGSKIQFPIQGSGQETRAFCYVDDVVDGILAMYQLGEHRNVYHIGNNQMVSISDLANKVGSIMGLELDIVPSTPPAGETPVRCPDIGKMQSLGYAPQTDLDQGLKQTIDWYLSNTDLSTDNEIL